MKKKKWSLFLLIIIWLFLGVFVSLIDSYHPPEHSSAPATGETTSPH